jgi:hypothetical protein
LSVITRSLRIPQAGKVSNGGLEEGDGTLLALVGHDLHKRDARSIVDADMDELPADAAVAVDHARMPSGDAVPDTADSAELFNVEVNEFARVLALIAPDRLSGFQSTQLIQAEPTQDAADSGGRDAGLGSDLLAGPALTAQPLDLLDNRLRRRPVQPMRPGWAVLQPRQSFEAIAINPFANGPQADARGLCNRLRRLPALNLSNNALSTARREPGILMHVHPVLLGI